MVLDQVENFIRVSVSGSHASGDSTISLQSGEASTLPDPSNGKYNLVWFDSQNYRLPDKDPNVEIVRVNSVDTANDTVSVTRGQENTTATTKSETGAEYELLLGPTAKTIQEIDQFKLDASAYSPEADTHTRYEDSEAISAINNDSDHGSTASHNYFSGSHNDLSNIGSSDHHTKTTSASELTDVSPDSNSSAHHSRYADSEAISAINNDSDHGSTASHNYFSGSHNDLSDVGSNDHHTRYSDSEARSAVDGASVSVGGSSGSVQTSNFQIEENSSTNSLDFNYTG